MIKQMSQSSIGNNVDYRNLSADIIPSSEYLIQTYEVGATPLASITFDNLSQYHGVYKHLQICMVARSNRGSNLERVDFVLNADTGANYSAHELQGAGGPGLFSGGKSNISVAEQGYVSGNTNTANSFGAIVSDILDPFETTKYTTMRALGGFTGATNYVQLFSSSWRNTNALTSIQIKPFGGTEWLTGSRFSLYGVTA